MARHLLNLALSVCLGLPATGQQTAASGNALGGAASRFLRDAGTSQIAWRAWGPAAIDAAKKANRPLFVSVGYASSYDSYRLHQEVFNVGTIGDTLNGYYVPVLVDRLEQPEVAEALDAIQIALSGSATTPSSFILTPALEPFAVKADLENWQVFLATNASRWANDRNAAVTEGRANLEKARRRGEVHAPAPVDATTLDAVIDALSRSFDSAGPQPLTLAFALRYAEQTGNKAVRAAALDQLRVLAKSPRRDLIGGGFHHGSGLDKLLTDQALLAGVYLDAWQIGRDPVFEDVVRSTLEYVLRDLHLAKSAFHASQDGHSLVPGQGPEFINGAFYVWSKEELISLLGRDEALKTFRILGMAKSADNLPVFVEPLAEETRRKMLEYRQKRPQPFRDFNATAGGNGLMISAFARAGAVLGETRYTDAASAAARLVTSKLWNAKTRTLDRSDAATVPTTRALGEDYAFLIQGLLDLFDATYDVQWLELATALQKRQDELFWNASLGRYETGSALPDALRGLLNEDDGDTPSVNAVAAMNLLRLAGLTGVDSWRAKPDVIFESLGGRLRLNGSRSAHLASALTMRMATPRVVVVTGDARNRETGELLRSLHQGWEPLRAVVFLPVKGPQRIRMTTALPFLAPLTNDPEHPVAYVCEKGECRRM
jgi:uncharacterized protein YyaL (SSP411 family)